MAAPIPWNQAKTPIDWDVIAINWNTAAKANTGTYGALSDQAITGETALSPQITFGALADQPTTGLLSISASGAFGSLGGIASTGGMSFAGNVSMGALAGQAVSGGLTIAETASLEALGDYINSVNHAEDVSIGALGDWSSTSAFLWNEKSDIATTWTKVP